ncbi:MAG TPA: hypothetical protein VM695_10205, partial [Phycisphaerae bacterium]|nr:hypothetical protein [Phycisphaerae bacterium]
TLEALRLRHNAEAAKVRDGKLTPSEFAAWKLAWWKPRQALAVEAVLAHRDKVLTPPKEDEDDKRGYQEAKAAWKASKRFAVDLDALDVVPAKALPDPYQDLSTYAEVDPDGDLTIGEAGNVRCTFDVMARTVDAHLTKDFGAGHFGNYTHDFDCLVSVTSSFTAHADLWGVSNAAGSFADRATGQTVHWYYSGTGSIQYLNLREMSTGAIDAYVATLSTPYYCTAVRAGTAGSCEIYDAPGRLIGDLLDTLTAVVANTTYRYHIALASREASGPPSITGYVENHDLHEAAGFVPYPRPINPDMTGGISQ